MQIIKVSTLCSRTGQERCEINGNKGNSKDKCWQAKRFPEKRVVQTGKIPNEKFQKGKGGLAEVESRHLRS